MGTPRVCARTLLGLAVAAGLVGAAGCSDEQGIIIEVTRDSTLDGQEIKRLHFVIGARYGSLFVQTPNGENPAGGVDVLGRDLATAPYRLMLHDQTPGEAAGTVRVAVVGTVGEQVVAFGALESQPFVNAAILRPIVLTASSGPEVLETGCVKWATDTGYLTIGSTSDKDCDGETNATDCRDQDAAVNTYVSETCWNEIDDDCDGETDEETDTDLDGYSTCQGDCADDNLAVNPGATELCDGVDNNCDGSCDEGFDTDGDLYTTCGTKPLADTWGECEVGLTPDCDDASAAINPGVAEVCDGLDNDCSGACDDGLAGEDTDSFTSCGTIPGWATTDGYCMAPSDLMQDCDSADPAVYPAALELCNGKDDNCDGYRITGNQPCYYASADTCLIGTIACNDDDSGNGYGSGAACHVSEGQTTTVVAMDFCNAWTTCAQAASTGIDLWRCANEAVAGPAATGDCVLLYDLTGTVCEHAKVTLPAAVNLEWSISLIGGTEQAHYSAGFYDSSTGGLSATGYCGSVFYIPAKSSGDAWPQPDTFAFEYSAIDGTGAEIRRVMAANIDPVPTLACPLEGALVCTLPSP